MLRILVFGKWWPRMKMKYVSAVLENVTSSRTDPLLLTITFLNVRFLASFRVVPPIFRLGTGFAFHGIRIRGNGPHHDGQLRPN
jgi:hypothetical protein